MTWLFLLIILLLSVPNVAFSECVKWVLCPYVQNPQELNKRYVSIVDDQIKSRWEEIEVEGDQAVVCLWENATPNSCRSINRIQVKELLKAPHRPYFNEETKRIMFFDGREGRETIKRPFNNIDIKRRIQDTVVDDMVRGR